VDTDVPEALGHVSADVSEVDQLRYVVEDIFIQERHVANAVASALDTARDTSPAAR
jgi:hypothetical protein